MSRAFRSALVILSLFAAASFATACANSPTDIVAEDGYHNNNCMGCGADDGGN